MRLVTWNWRAYLQALLLVAVMTLAGLLIGGVVAPANLVMLYLVAVVIAAMRLGRGPSILTAFLSVIVFDFFMVPPRHTLVVADTQYLLTFAGLLIVSLVISSLAGEARDQAEAAQRRELQAVALYELSRDLSSAGERDAILHATLAHICDTFGRDAAIFLPLDNRLQVAAATAAFRPTEDQRSVAEWALQHDHPAGRGTEALPATDIWCLPLRTPRGVVGVLGISPATGRADLNRDQRRLLETFAGQAALAIERAQLAERAHQAHLLEATEKLHRALLNSISHDLRTPLVTITGAFSSLETAAGRLDEPTRTSLARAGREEAERLNHLVGNLLDMTRIEAGALKLTEEPADVSEALGVVLDRLGDELKDRPIGIEVPLDLPPVPMDMPLMVQALANVLDNAAKYSPDGSPIEIEAGQSGATVRIEINDRGVGIPKEDLERVFDHFYRVDRPRGVSGTGLGLAISRGIVEAHGGVISAGNRTGGGTTVTIELPLEHAAPGKRAAGINSEG
jgi:two-component system, OmpR family, sensor histidine kinase KdpD